MQFFPNYRITLTWHLVRTRVLKETSYQENEEEVLEDRNFVLLHFINILFKLPVSVPPFTPLTHLLRRFSSTPPPDYLDVWIDSFRCLEKNKKQGLSNVLGLVGLHRSRGLLNEEDGK